MDRREFLKLLGWGSASLASMQFAYRLPFVFADNLASIPNGPITSEWITAQTLLYMSAKLDGLRKNPLPLLEGEGIRGEESQFGVQLSHIPERDWKLGRDEFAVRYIEPVAMQLADEIEFSKPMAARHLPLPNAVEFASRIHDRTTGLSLRFIKVWDIFGTPAVYDEKERRIIHEELPPGWVQRFDVAIA